MPSVDNQSGHNIRASRQTRHKKAKRGRQISRSEDKDLLNDSNSHALSVRMRNPYPGVPVIRILSLSHTVYGHYASLYPRMCNLRFFIVGSTDAFTGLKLPHLPFHATDSYKWTEGVMNCLRGSASSVLRINGDLEQISARHKQIWRRPCYI